MNNIGSLLNTQYPLLSTHFYSMKNNFWTKSIDIGLTFFFRALKKLSPTFDQFWLTFFHGKCHKLFLLCWLRTYATFFCWSWSFIMQCYSLFLFGKPSGSILIVSILTHSTSVKNIQLIIKTKFMKSSLKV